MPLTEFGSFSGSFDLDAGQAPGLYRLIAEIGAQPAVQFSKTVARIGEKGLFVFIRSTYPDGKSAPNAGGVLNIGLEQAGAKPEEFVKLPFTTDDRGQCQLALPELTRHGRLRAVAVLETLGGKPMARPGEKAQVLALLPVGWGKSESGVVWETISGDRIHDTRSTTFKGRSRWFEVEAKPEYGNGALCPEIRKRA